MAFISSLFIGYLGIADAGLLNLGLANFSSTNASPLLDITPSKVGPNFPPSPLISLVNHDELMAIILMAIIMKQHSKMMQH
jgi:hypothetical protein